MSCSAAERTKIDALLAAGQLLELGADFALCRFPGKEPALFHARPGARDEEMFVAKPWGNAEELHFYPFSEKTDVPKASGIAEVYFQMPMPESTVFENYATGFDVFQKAFARKVLRKAVLSRVKLVEKAKDFDPLEFFRKAEEAHPDAFVTLIAHSRHGIWLGATPEVLLASKGGTALTHSLAGTRSASVGKQHAWGEKERSEQSLVSAHVRSVLQKSGADILREIGPETVKAGSVAHLRTSFEFTPPADLDTFLQNLHPTPAIAGLPVAPAVDLIKATEKHDRGLYAGYLGTRTQYGASDATFNLYVNLRCMRVGRDHLALYLGGGLTEGSGLKAEWEETENKALTLEKLLHG